MIASRKTIAAAHLIGISQPAISRAIASLEQRVGRQLFRRDGGRLVPTADAFALEEQAAAVFSALDRLGAWHKPSEENRLLRVVASPTLAQHLLPGFISAMRREEASLAFAIDVCTSAEVLAAVADRRADLGLLDMSFGHPAVRAEMIRSSEAHVLMPEEHPLAAQAEITVQDLADVPLILLPHRFASRGEIDRSFEAAGVRPNIVAEVSVSAVAAELVRRRLGLSIFNPFPIAEQAAPGTVWRPFRPSIAYRTYILFPASGGTEPAARRFADLILRETATG